MRISDWSSDVCSSDLVAKHDIMEAHPSREHRERAQGPASEMGPVAHREQQRVIGNRLVLDLLDRVPAPHALRLGLGTGKMSWIGQLGRAPGRERVGPYV